MKKNIANVLVAIETGIVTTLLGGWDVTLEILIIIMILDYVTGLAKGFKSKTLSSSKGFKGILKKVIIFVVVILAAQIDKIAGNETNLFRNGTVFFFISNDALSILENVGELGIKLPKFLKDAILKLRDSQPKEDE